VNTLVLGASPNSDRYSYKAVQKLAEKGHRVTAIGLRAGLIGNIPIQLQDKPSADIHTITLYLSPDNQVPLYEYIIATAPQRIIFNPGTENPEFYPLLRANLPQVRIEIACTLVLLATGAY
jgi:uncharacterized protein